MELKRKNKRYLPTFIASSISTIDYSYLKEQGITHLLFDYDNTMAEHNTSMISAATKELFDSLHEQGFDLFMITNAHPKRVKGIAAMLKIPLLYRAHKPFKRRLKKFMKKHQIDHKSAVLIGDQLMTDIALANKLKMMSIKVEPIATSGEWWLTRFNRNREQKKMHLFNQHDLLNKMGGK